MGLCSGFVDGVSIGMFCIVFWFGIAWGSIMFAVDTDTTIVYSLDRLCGLAFSLSRKIEL
jgi:hypothetical protein